MTELLNEIPEAFNWITFVFMVPVLTKTVGESLQYFRSWLYYFLTIQFTISNQNSRFFLYRTALAKLVPKARRMKEVDIPGRGPSWLMEEEEKETEVQPDHGVYWFKFEGTRIRVDFNERDVKNPAAGGGGIKTLGSNESITFEFFTKNREVVHNFRGFVSNLERENRKLRTTIWSNKWASWVPIAKRFPRGKDTLFYEGGIHQEILEDLIRFQGAAQEYRDRGRVHKRGYMFYGPPGNGKTTLILWLASQLGVDVAILSSCTDDETFLGLVTRVPKGAVLLLEDVDALFASSRSREKRKVKVLKGKKTKLVVDDSPEGENEPIQKTVSLSVLLNYLDGMLSREGQIVFMTTNYFDKIDAALLRRGRADRRLLLGSPSSETAKRMFQATYPKADPGPFLKVFDQLEDKPSVADLEGVFDRFGPDEAPNALKADTK